MKTKLICIMLMLAFALNLSACGNGQENMNSTENGSSIEMTQSEKDNALENIGNESGDNNKSNPQNSDTDKNTMDVGTVNGSAFSGKVSDCCYADGNRIIVAADKLYLYDTQKGEIIASADISLKELNVQTYLDGYFIVGEENSGASTGSFATSQSSNGVKGYLLNKSFETQNTISFSGLLSDDFILQTAGVIISQDGKQVVFGGLQGLYLYDTSSQQVRTILNYSENGRANNMGIVNIDSLTFTGNNTLVYVGTATDISNGGDGFSVYGTVSIDGANLTITKITDYQVDAGEVQKGGNLLVMSQSFNKNNGTLLMLDTASMTEKMITFSSGNEGKDGVYCSEQGKYVATSILGEASVTINIYDTASGKVIHTETVKDNNSTYFQRVPQILILDESNTCIVVLGRGIGEVSTLITTFGFKG
jgi:hypothetical protein